MESIVYYKANCLSEFGVFRVSTKFPRILVG